MITEDELIRILAAYAAIVHSPGNEWPAEETAKAYYRAISRLALIAGVGSPQLPPASGPEQTAA